MEKETVVMILESLMSECSRRFSDNEKALKIRNWTVKLSDISEEQGMKGLDKALDMDMDFMLSIGKFKELCLTEYGCESTEDEANEAWSMLIDNLNYYANPIFKNGIISECIRKMGGWKQLCSMLEKDIPFRKKDFIALYSVYKKRGDEYRQDLIGAGNAENRVMIGFDRNDQVVPILEQIELGQSVESKVLGMLKQKRIDK